MGTLKGTLKGALNGPWSTEDAAACSWCSQASSRRAFCHVHTSRSAASQGSRWGFWVQGFRVKEVGTGSGSRVCLLWISGVPSHALLPSARFTSVGTSSGTVFVPSHPACLPALWRLGLSALFACSPGGPSPASRPPGRLLRFVLALWVASEPSAPRLAPGLHDA